MSYEEPILTIQMQGDLQAQSKALEGFDDVLTQTVGPVMQQDVDLLASVVAPEIPFVTGYAQETFNPHVEGTGLNLTGYVGWSGRPSAWWMNIVEYGARPHDLNKGKTVRSKAGMARFNKAQAAGEEADGTHVRDMTNGQWWTMHTHPGFQGRFLLSRAWEGNEETVVDNLTAGVDQALQSLVVTSQGSQSQEGTDNGA